MSRHQCNELLDLLLRVFRIRGTRIATLAQIDYLTPIELDSMRKPPPVLWPAFHAR